MRYVCWPLALLLAFVLESRVSILSVLPNLTCLLVYYAGLRHGDVKGMGTGLAVGFLEDSLSSSLLGPHMLGKALAGYCASLFTSGRLFRWTPLLGILSLAAITILDGAAVYVSLGMFDKFPVGPGRALFIILMQAILNSFAGLFLRPRHAD